MSAGERLKNPWWLFPFLGRVPIGVTAPQLRLLGAVALALFFEEYDLAMLALALPQIASEFGVEVSAMSEYLWVIRTGALPAFVLIPYADRLGRRPVFLASTALMGLLTFCTAFAQTPLQFVVFQALTRTFFVSGSAVAFVIVTEEFPPQHRGWGLGILSALGATGHGLSAGIYGLVNHLPFGFRALYAVGIVPLLLVPYFLSRITETDHYRRHAEGRQTPARNPGLDAIAPLIALARAHPGRATGVAATGFVTAVGSLPSFQFGSLYAQQALGWTPGDVGRMVIGAGAVGIIGNVVAGRLGDLFGRRRVGAVLVACFPAMSYLFYNAGASWAVAASYAGLVFCFMGGRVMLRAISTELFPTSQRGAASGVYTVLEQAGGVVGLFALARYHVQDVNGLAVALPALALVLWIGAGIVLTFPETRGTELT